MRPLFYFFTVLVLAGSVSAQWKRFPVATEASFRGLSVVSEKIVWASGTAGTVVRTADGGRTWDVFRIPGAEKLDLRDIEAFDGRTAYALSIGNGDSSRIYKTIDGGKTWSLQFRNADEKAFFDAIACWDVSTCIAMSDPIGGRYRLIATADGGTSWLPLPEAALPAAKSGEAAFAASGTCLIVNGRTDAFLVTGGTDARVLRSADRGRTWSSAATPIVSGSAGSGIFSIAMFGASAGAIVGGNYEKPDLAGDTLAFTNDGGRTWTAASGLGGYRSGVAYLDRTTLVAVGTNGSDISADGGRTWQALDEANYNVVQARGKKAVWAAGPKGLIAKLERRK